MVGNASMTTVVSIATIRVPLIASLSFTKLSRYVWIDKYARRILKGFMCFLCHAAKVPSMKQKGLSSHSFLDFVQEEVFRQCTFKFDRVVYHYFMDCYNELLLGNPRELHLLYNSSIN